MKVTRTGACRSGRGRQIRTVVGLALGPLALLELAPQVMGLLGAAPVAIGLGAGVGVGDLLALDVLLLALPAAQLLDRRIVRAHGRRR